VGAFVLCIKTSRDTTLCIFTTSLHSCVIGYHQTLMSLAMNGRHDVIPDWKKGQRKSSFLAIFPCFRFVHILCLFKYFTILQYIQTFVSRTNILLWTFTFILSQLFVNLYSFKSFLMLLCYLPYINHFCHNYKYLYFLHMFYKMILYFVGFFILLTLNNHNLLTYVHVFTKY